MTRGSIKWHLLQWHHRLGLPGWLGLLLLLAGLWGDAVVLPRLRSQIEQTQGDMARIRELLREQSETQQTVALTPEQAIGVLVGRLPKPQDRSHVLAGLLQASEEQKLQLDSLQLHQSDDGLKSEVAGSRPLIARQQVEVPLKGSYAQLRDWLETILAEQPALSVDDVQIKRGDALTDQLDARVRLSLWVWQGGELPSATSGVPAATASAPIKEAP